MARISYTLRSSLARGFAWVVDVQGPYACGAPASRVQLKLSLPAGHAAHDHERSATRRADILYHKAIT
jgi:hypothetical protein